MWANLAFKLFRQELKRGELTIITAAIALAVMTVMTLSSITDRIGLSISEKSNEFIAADRVLSSNYEINPEFITHAKLQNIQTAQLLNFDSMLFAGDDMQLAYVKAADQHYPLKGELKVQDTLEGEVYTVSQGPSEGNVWLSDTVFYSLNIKVGDNVEIGSAQFKVERVLAEEPDAPFSVFSSSRRVLINLNDVPRTEVIQPGSRIYYRTLFAGESQSIEQYYQWLKPQLKENQTWYGVKDRQSPVADSVKRAERFLLLAGLLGIMLAAVAIAVSAKRYCERQYDPVAMMKTLGGSRAVVRKIYLLHLSLVTAFAVLVGLLLGTFLQSVAVEQLASAMGNTLPKASAMPIVIATFTGVICAVMFSLKPLLDLFDIPPLRVLRRNLGDSLAISKIHLALSGATVFSLMWMYSQNVMLSGILFASSIALAAILFGCSRLILSGSRRLGLKPSNSWSLAIASLQKRANANSVQLISFALAIKLMLFLFVLKNDLISDWQNQLPIDTPNAFLVNISEAERQGVSDYLAANQMTATDFYPVVRGRVNGINGELVARSVSQQDNEKKDEEARSGVGRELNLTWLSDAPKHNKVVEGTWFGENVVAEASIEQSMAKRLGVKLGDTLDFLIGSERFSVTITSMREVNWASLQPNFFIILSPDVLSNFPATYISAVNVPSAQKRALQGLFLQYPSISIIDVDTIIKQIRSTIEQVSMAISFVLVIVLLCGALVLISQVQASLQERLQEVVILRTLGARGRLIKNAILYEFFLLGLFAGVVAAIFSDIALLVVQYMMFDQIGRLHLMIWLVGPVVGALFVSLLGYGMIAKTLNKNTQGLVRAL